METSHVLLILAAGGFVSHNLDFAALQIVTAPEVGRTLLANQLNATMKQGIILALLYSVPSLIVLTPFLVMDVVELVVPNLRCVAFKILVQVGNVKDTLDGVVVQTIVEDAIGNGSILSVDTNSVLMKLRTKTLVLLYHVPQLLVHV